MIITSFWCDTIKLGMFQNLDGDMLPEHCCTSILHMLHEPLHDMRKAVFYESVMISMNLRINAVSQERRCVMEPLLGSGMSLPLPFLH